MDWNRSQIFCRSLRAHLANIDTQEELVNEKSLRQWCVSGFWEADLQFLWRVLHECLLFPAPLAFPLALWEFLALLDRSPQGRLWTLEMVQRVSL